MLHRSKRLIFILFISAILFHFVRADGRMLSMGRTESMVCFRVGFRVIWCWEYVKDTDEESISTVDENIEDSSVYEKVIVLLKNGIKVDSKQVAGSQLVTRQIRSMYPGNGYWNSKSFASRSSSGLNRINFDIGKKRIDRRRSAGGHINAAARRRRRLAVAEIQREVREINREIRRMTSGNLRAVRMNSRDTFSAENQRRRQRQRPRRAAPAPERDVFPPRIQRPPRPRKEEKPPPPANHNYPTPPDPAYHFKPENNKPIEWDFDRPGLLEDTTPPDDGGNSQPVDPNALTNKLLDLQEKTGDRGWNKQSRAPGIKNPNSKRKMNLSPFRRPQTQKGKARRGPRN